MRFADRRSAGERLAERVAGEIPSGAKVVVLGIGAGGRAVAGPVAERLGAPLGNYAAEHLRLPWRPGFAFGAVTDDSHHYVDPEVTADHSLGAREILSMARALHPALRKQPHDRPDLAGRFVLLVDDGLAWGYRALAVHAAVRAASAAGVLLATPCAARDAVARCAAAELPHVALVVSDAPRFDLGDFYESGGI